MKQALARLITLIILLLNQILLMFGYHPFDVEDDQVYEGVSAILGVGFSIYVWWKNNNMTSEAHEAQTLLNNRKKYRKNNGGHHG